MEIYRKELWTEHVKETRDWVDQRKVIMEKIRKRMKWRKIKGQGARRKK